MKLKTGDIFSEKYRIVCDLDSGGFSDVYYAYDISKRPPVEVAIKIFDLDVDKQGKRESMALFLREAYCLSKLDHPNIIQIHDFGHSKDRYFIVTEYLDGTTLYDIVDKTGPMPEGEVAMIAYEIAKALKFLKHHRVVHRDIKPINIMVNDNGDVKLIDFGLSRHIDERTVTKKNVFVGTPQFAAPECIKRETEIDNSADIFSLGASCYFFLTNIEPFAGKNPKEVFNNRLTQVTRPVKELNSSITRGFSNLIDNMISFEREGRPDIDQLIDRLFDIVTRT